MYQDSYISQLCRTFCSNYEIGLEIIGDTLPEVCGGCVLNLGLCHKRPPKSSASRCKLLGISSASPTLEPALLRTITTRGVNCKVILEAHRFITKIEISGLWVKDLDSKSVQGFLGYSSNHLPDLLESRQASKFFGEELSYIKQRNFT